MTKRQMTIASFCAMTCAEGGFHKFLTERYRMEYGDCPDKDEAAAIVKFHCKIESRSDLNKKGKSQDLWLALQSEYKDWLRC